MTGEQQMITDFGMIIGLMMLTFFFTASEMAFVASNKLFVLVRSQKQGRYKLLHNLLAKPELYLYTVLVGNNLTVSALTIVTEDMFFTQNAVAESLYFSLLLSMVVLIIGEIIPKTITKDNPERYAVVYAPAIRLFYYLFYPMILISTSLSELIFFFAKLKTKGFKRPVLTKSDLAYFVKDGFEGENMSVHENKLISGIFDFNDRNAGDVLIPRTDIVMLQAEDDFNSAKAHLLEEEKIFTRLPVYENNADTVIGIVNINDLIMLQSGTVRDIMEEPHFAPETITLGNLLVDMKKKNVHLSVIVDEYGQVTGIVTLEDIIEELIGDISDEYDKDETIDIKKGKMVIDGDMKTDDINESGIVLIPESNKYETIAGYILFRLGRMPVENDTIVLDKNTIIRVIKIIENRIETIEIEQRKIIDENQ